MSEARARVSQLSDQAAPSNELDHFIDSDMDSNTICFQAAIFSIDVDVIREQKCCISHSPIELIFIKILLQ